MNKRDNNPDSEYNKNISGRLKSIIKDYEKTTQEKFAKNIHVHHTYISQILTHKKVPSERLLDLICSRYNINSNWLKNGIGEVYVDLSEIKYNKVHSMFKYLNPTFQEVSIKFLQLLIDVQDSLNNKTI